MARMHDAIVELGIKPSLIPEPWEAYFVASQYKYTNAQNNQQRYGLNWYRENNFWLDLSPEILDQVLIAAGEISQDDLLYEWSGFIRYLLFETKIIHENEQLLEDLVPRRYLKEKQDLFLLVTLLASIDRSVATYRKNKLTDEKIQENFAIISTLLSSYETKNNRLGIPALPYLPRLAWGKLLVYNGFAFEAKKKVLPGKVYRNKRSTELSMVANSGILFTKDGYRLTKDEEERILETRNTREITISDAELQDEANVEGAEILQNFSELPEGVWESKSFHTESGGFVANPIQADGRAQSSVRIYEAQHWVQSLTDDSKVLELYITDPQELDFEFFLPALSQALEDVDREGAEVEAIICESYLLNPNIIKHLQGAQSLVRFIQLFHLYPLYDDRDRVQHDLFGSKVKHLPIKLWPEESILQVAFKASARDGMETRTNGGFILRDELRFPTEEQH